MAFSFRLSNYLDKEPAEDGNNIWIHGTTKTLLPKQSKGCVVA